MRVVYNTLRKESDLFSKRDMQMDISKSGNPTKITLDEDRKKAILTKLGVFYAKNLDEELSSFRAEQLLNFFVKALGPPIYNQAVTDARAFMMAKLDDLDAEFYAPEET